MTVAWLIIDEVGRRKMMIWGAAVLSSCFALLCLFAGLVMTESIEVPRLPFAILGVIVLYVATAAFGIGWLPQPWLIPTEIYPSTARAQGAAISVVVWGFANFAVTFLSPIFFNNLQYWIFLIFAGSNAIAGLWTWVCSMLVYGFRFTDIWTQAYSPETGGRTFEENASFFDEAKDHDTWRVHKVNGGEFKRMPHGEKSREDDENTPLLSS